MPSVANFKQFKIKISKTIYRSFGKKGSDVNIHIIAGGKWKQRMFKAHTWVLKDRSDYFKVALSNQWARKDPNGIIIFHKENISPKIFDLILK